MAIFDIRENKNLADVMISEEFEAPKPQRIADQFNLDEDEESMNDLLVIKSGPIILMDSKRIKIIDLSIILDKSLELYFMVGINQPINNNNNNRLRIPNELGYLEPLNNYYNETIILELPGDLNFFQIEWISIWNHLNNHSIASILIPKLDDDSSNNNLLNIPPSINSLIKPKFGALSLPNCQQLHSRLQLNWEIFGPQITFELVGQIRSNEYMAFGLSGSKNSSRMIGSDVAISFMDGHIGYTLDYNITGRFPCTNILGHFNGVCPDSKLGGIDNNFQILTFSRDEGITRIQFRRNLISEDEGDLNIIPMEKIYIIWSIGRMNSLKEPRIHTIYPKNHNIFIIFGRKADKSSCFPFSYSNYMEEIYSDISLIESTSTNQNPWINEYLKDPFGPLKLMNQSITTFYARIGVSGGERGYSRSSSIQSSSLPSGSPGIVWYINGLMAPILTLKRGIEYSFIIEGGNDATNGRFYHPLYITDDPNGGYIKNINDNDRKKYHIYAGIEFDRKGRSNPSAFGRLCLWDYNDKIDPRKVDLLYHSFSQFRSNLNYSCSKNNLGNNPSILKWTPSQSTPDIVYYQSYTQRNMGGKIIILDNNIQQLSSSSYSSSFFSSSFFSSSFFYYYMIVLIITFCSNRLIE